jgi:ATP-binding cassette subfamily F protein 3
LLLDEPTNHLDIPAQEALQEVLEDFPGTILLVTHDRYLVDRLATQIWEISGGQLRVFQGTYRQYLEWQEKANALPRRATVRLVENSQPGRASSQPRASLPRANGAASARRSNGGSAANRRSAASRARTLQALEARIQEAEASLERLGREMEKADRSKGVERLQSLSWDYVAAQQQLDRLMAEWEHLAA